jgi:DNA-binding IscR family transcriptional regulator
MPFRSSALWQGLNVLGTCIMGFKQCPFNHTCAMHEVWEETRNSILKVLNNTTLDQLLKAVVWLILPWFAVPCY